MQKVVLSRSGEILKQYLNDKEVKLPNDYKGEVRLNLYYGRRLFVNVDNGKVEGLKLWYRTREGDLDFEYLFDGEEENLLSELKRKIKFN